jgi:hypothetical protein
MANVDLHLAVQLRIDASVTSAEDAVAYIQTVVRGLNDPAAGSDVTVTVSTPVFGLDRQLGRLMDHNPAFAARVRKLHDGLVRIGYSPTLPKSSKDVLPSYISYIDPATGVNFGNLNSEKIYIQRRDLRDELKDQPHFGSDNRYANCHLTSDEAVQAVLEVAAREKK